MKPTYDDLLNVLKKAKVAMDNVASLAQQHNPETGFLKDVDPYEAYRTLLPAMIHVNDAISEAEA